MSDDQRDSRLRQANECLELARKAEAAGDKVTFIAAISLAAQLTQLARIQAPWGTPPTRKP